MAVGMEDFIVYFYGFKSLLGIKNVAGSPSDPFFLFQTPVDNDAFPWYSCVNAPQTR